MSTAFRAAPLAAFIAAVSPVAVAAPQLVPPAVREQSEALYPADGKGDASVVLVLLVSADGEVLDATVREGVNPFADAAVLAVKRWRFSPATRDGRPVSARVLAAISFHAPQQAEPAVKPREPSPVFASDAGADRSAHANADAAPLEELIEIAVKGEHEELGTIHIPRAETRLIPGAFGDPFRVVEALPAMSPWLSGLPYFYARGMSQSSRGSGSMRTRFEAPPASPRSGTFRRRSR